jgi:hypothetical protein
VAAIRVLLYLLLAPPLCPARCDAFVDYSAIAARLAPEPGGISVIRTVHSRIGGNLLTRVPDSFVIVPERTPGVEAAIAGDLPRRCTLVWFRSFLANPTMEVEEALALALDRPPGGDELGAIARVETVTGGWQTHLLAARNPPPVFGLAELDPEHPICGGETSAPGPG